MDAFNPSAVATEPVPPNESMISATDDIEALIVRKLRTGQEFAKGEKLFDGVCVAIRLMADSVKLIAKRLVTTREAMGLSQTEFCDQIKIEKNIYNPFEKGRRRITIDAAIRIRERFGIPLDWIFCGDPGRVPVEIYDKITKAA